MKEIDTLCIGGGGIFGLSYITIIEQLQFNYIIDLKNIKKYIGTSVGSIICFNLILGYSPQILKNFCLKFDFGKIKLKPSFTNLIQNLGIDNGEKISEILKGFLYEKTELEDITFRELFSLTGKSFKVIATRYDNAKEMVFDESISPNMSVLTAIRMSLSIPLIFTPVKYEDNYYVDGCLTNNFAINYCNLEKTIGITSKCNLGLRSDSITSYITGLVQILFKNSSKMNFNLIKNNDFMFEVEVSPSEAIDFDLNFNTKNRMFDLGNESSEKKIIKIVVEDIMDSLCNSINDLEFENYVEPIKINNTKIKRSKSF